MYVRNGQVENTYRYYNKKKLTHAFKVIRYDEVKWYSQFDAVRGTSNNKGQPKIMLLWHGTGQANFMGILSQGLRIAPPEAPVSGYKFGKGIYFADSFSKSINYCKGGNLLFLCEVLLGDSYECQTGQYMEQPMKGFNSTKGLGKSVPNENEMFYNSAGVCIPLGSIQQSENPHHLDFNEYIVYDTKQVIIRYIVQVDM